MHAGKPGKTGAKVHVIIHYSCTLDSYSGECLRAYILQSIPLLQIFSTRHDGVCRSICSVGYAPAHLECLLVHYT